MSVHECLVNGASETNDPRSRRGGRGVLPQPSPLAVTPRGTRVTPVTSVASPPEAGWVARSGTVLVSVRSAVCGGICSPSAGGSVRPVGGYETVRRHWPSAPGQVPHRSSRRSRRRMSLAPLRKCHVPQVETTDPLRVLIVDNEQLIRSGIALILGTAPDLRVVAAVEGGSAVAAVEEHRPDVVLLDIRMPDVDGLTVLRELMRRHPAPQVAMLTTFDSDEYLGEALSLGARGFLLKDTAPDTLIGSVRTLATGAGCLSASVVSRLGVRPQRAELGKPSIRTLSERERQVLAFIGHGLSNSEIGARLHLGTATVKDHVSSLLTKLGVANRVRAAVLADRAGLVAQDLP